MPLLAVGVLGELLPVERRVGLASDPAVAICPITGLFKPLLARNAVGGKSGATEGAGEANSELLAAHAALVDSVTGLFGAPCDSALALAAAQASLSCSGSIP